MSEDGVGSAVFEKAEHEMPWAELTSEWGRFGPDDQRGALNNIDETKVRAANALVRSGQVLSLSQPVGPSIPPSPHRSPTARFMNRDAGDYFSGARSPGGFRFAEDTVLLSTHSGTHVDALSHCWHGDQLHNGHPAASIRSTRGAQKLGVETMGPIVTRGVLLDFVALTGGPLPASTAIGGEELEAAFARADTRPERGDAVLLYTGWWETAGIAPTIDRHYYDREPGLSDEGARWLERFSPSIVGADNYSIEVQPSPGGETFPVHLRLLWGRGIPLVENLDLQALAAAEATEFMFIASPIPLQGSTASPVAPLAVL